MLIRKGLPYDSNEGRAYAAAITALMQGETLRTSAELAKGLSPFVHYWLNKEPMMEVVKKHRAAIEDIGKRQDLYGENFDTKSVNGLEELIQAARAKHDEAIDLAKQYGFRNAQVTVLAPTGTIARLMGCDTTGVEPADALSISKNLAGGGRLELVVEEVPNALLNLGYKENQVGDIVDYIKKNKVVEGAPWLEQKHYPIFDTAFSPVASGRTIDFKGHIKMLGATQPFISGAISKTNNLPEWATVREIYDGYLLGYNLGLKAISVFRYNSKPVSVLTFGDNNDDRVLKRGEKKELPAQREVFESEVRIDGTPFHIMVSEYSDGTPGQIVFLSYKAGSTLGNYLRTSGVLASKSLRGGMKLEEVIDSWKGNKFEPTGMVVGDPWIKSALSPLDYAAKFLELHYLGNLDVAENKENLDRSKLRGSRNGAFRTYEMNKVDQWDFEQVINHPVLGGFKNGNGNKELSSEVREDLKRRLNNERGVTCKECGNMMVQVAPSCYDCMNCDNRIGGCGL